MLLINQHIAFLTETDLEQERLPYLMSMHLKMGCAYWGLGALQIMGKCSELELVYGEESEEAKRKRQTDWEVSPATIDLDLKRGTKGINDFLLTCWDAEAGAWGPGPLQVAHLTSTLHAIFLLAFTGNLEASGCSRDKTLNWVASLQRTDGSFRGDDWGETDPRFSFCAAAIVTLLNGRERINLKRARAYILRCYNWDGGFASTEGGESHAAYAYCCVASLALLGGLEDIDCELTGNWLAARQISCGGFNGRPTKAPDVCYSFWVFATLCIIGKKNLINSQALIQFILQCQNKTGGIADRPGNMPDAFHTFFGIASLSLLGMPGLESIDPIWALPITVTEKFGVHRFWEQIEKHQN